MVKNALNTILRFNKKGKRNAFDLSNRVVFNCAAGQLTPFVVRDCNPGDHWEMSVNDVVKSVGMSSMNFTRLKANFEFYFVPYRLLWRWWPQFITQVNDAGSDQFGLRSTSDMGTGDFTSKSQTSVPFLTFAEWQEHGHDMTADMMGYNNDASSLVQLAQLLGYDPLWFGNLSTDGKKFEVWQTDTHENPHASSMPNINVFRFAAYQKIFYDWHRNTNYLAYVPGNFNFDSINGTNYAISLSDTPGVYSRTGLFTMRYAQWPLDFFTSLQPSINWLPNSVSGSVNIDLSKINVSAGQGVNGSAFGSSVASLNTSDDVVSMSSLRTVYALERLLMISERAAKTYSEQIKAHWGENVNSRDNNRCYKIGETSHVIGVNQVVSTSETSEGALGQLGAFGSGKSNSNRFTYDCHEHGILMGIMYVSPIADYPSDMMDSFNQKFTQYDYYQPEFDCLGMQYLQYKQLGGMFLGNPTSSASSSEFAANYVLGYQNRYLEYKSSYDFISNFFSGQNPTWTALRDFDWLTYGTSFSLYPEKLFYIDPKVLNSIFVQQFNGTPQTYQFLVDCQNSVQAVRNMSVDGTPLNVEHIIK